jgi:hypothetical protein
MKGSHTMSIVLMAFSLAACWEEAASQEDRKALVGVWTPDDGSRHQVAFRPDGIFDFLYDTGPPQTVLRLKWSLDTKGKVEIRGHDGSRYRTCPYSIDAGKLTIDNGSGAECLSPSVSPPVPMPRTFSKSP